MPARPCHLRALLFSWAFEYEPLVFFCLHSIALNGIVRRYGAILSQPIFLLLNFTMSIDLNVISTLRAISRACFILLHRGSSSAWKCREAAHLRRIERQRYVDFRSRRRSFNLQLTIGFCGKPIQTSPHRTWNDMIRFRIDIVNNFLKFALSFGQRSYTFLIATLGWTPGIYYYLFGRSHKTKLFRWPVHVF